MTGRLLMVVLVLTACTGSGARLEAIQELPNDLEIAVESAWDEFTQALGARIDCVAPVRLVLVSEVEDGDASYRAADRLVIVQIPTSPLRFRESMIHELAHHLDVTCIELESLRSGFLSAQGFPNGADWNLGETWETTPSEHFAEAIVAIVTGTRLLHDDDIAISPASLRLIEDWIGRAE